MDQLSLGAAVKSRRLARGWKQAELARRAGVSQSHVSMIENDQLPRSSADVVSRIAQALGASIDELLAGTIVPLPAEIDQLRAEGVPPIFIEELMRIWGDLLPEDRQGRG
jgi:transcriptional regulator with XRE-family HTH domain